MKRQLLLVAALSLLASASMAQKYEGLARTPQMGWNSWNTFEENIKNDDTIFNVIIGNPPYSIGQKSENDNAKNQKYKK